MLFSVVTVTYQNAAGLIATYDSVRQQTCRNFEWIVVDGASEDATRGLLQNWRQAITCLITEPDRNLYDAMNKGIQRARGDYLVFMNAGDAFAAPDVLQKLADIIAQQPAGFIYGDSYEEQADGRCLFKAARPTWLKFWGMFAHHQAMIYQRRALGDLRYDIDLKIGADYALTLAVLRKKPQVLRLPLVIAQCALPGISARNARYGRGEQLRIRHHYMRLPALANLGIYLLQTLVAQLKQHAPQLYRLTRFGAARC